MRRLVSIAVALAIGCATVPAKPAVSPVEGEAVAVQSAVSVAGEPLPEGVWMSVDLAAYKAARCAESEDLARRCQDELAGMEAPGITWLAIGLGVAAGFAAGLAVAR